jgi:transposase
MSDPVKLAPAEPTTRPTTARRDPAATRQRWVERLARFRSAEQTVAAFCAAEGVSVPTFYQWKRTLAAEVPPAAPPTFVPVRIAAPAVGPIELVLSGGAVVRFPAGTDPVVIAAVVRRIGGGGC